MFITTATIPDLERAIGQRQRLPSIGAGGHAVSLGSLLYLGMNHHLATSRQDAEATAVVESVGHPMVTAIGSLMGNGQRTLATDDFKTTPLDVFNVRSRDDLKSNQWIFFCDRFRRTASGGKQSRAILALASVMREMADNVVHGYGDGVVPCAALVGYHVTPSGMTFSVVDNGRGFRASLQQRDLWKHLPSENAALDAVVSKQATSRADQSLGGGFKQLFNGLLDLNGLLVLRSGPSAFILKNEHTHWKRREVESHPVPGAQVTYLFRRAGDPFEEQIN